MASCCDGCRVLQLPSAADFGGDGKQCVSRGIKLEWFCSISRARIASLPAEEDEDILTNCWTWISTSESDFCSRCDFCMLVLWVLSRRFGEAIETSIREVERDIGILSSAENIQLLLSIDTLSFYPFVGCRDIDGCEMQYKGVSSLLLLGTLNITISETDAPKVQNMDIVLPFEIFAEGEKLLTAKSSSVVYRRELTSNVLSGENVRMVKDWLDHCVHTHEKCATPLVGLDSETTIYKASEERLFLPTRLIRVSDPLEGEDPRIVHRDDIVIRGDIDGDSARYMALSYCWGSAEERLDSLTSNVSNISERTTAIPWTTIPKTFQDALVLAKELGIQYVWIDSLCILQGEGGDWEEESAMMWSIFSNAFITVIAAAGSSPHCGFLNRRVSRFCKVSWPLCASTYSLRHRPGTKWWGTDRMAEISGKRWITRGWTYQEERLARRVLMFGENKFFFDCRERELSEDTDVWLHRPAWSRVLYTHTLDGGEQAEDVTERQWKKKAHHHWQWLCIQYSHRKLTVPDDKLPAFSGVAAAVAAKIKSKYLAGLWEDNLMHDLFWNPVGKTKKSLTYRAPSWSWVSLDSEAISWTGPRTCLGETCRLYCRVLQANIILAGSNQFGAITSASLEIEGHNLGVELVKNTEHRLKGHPWKVVHQGQSIAEAKLDLLDSRPNDTVHALNTWALLISTCGNGRNATRGLLLEDAERNEGQFDVLRRVGTFTVPADTVFELQLKLSYWENLAPKLCILL